MKVRTDYVTNSSSSSFVICKKKLTAQQIMAIRLHREIARRMGLSNWEDAWEIRENDRFILGYTYMDNFDMSDFLDMIEVPDSIIEWSEYEHNLPEEDSEGYSCSD